VLYVNKLRVAGLLDGPIDPYFESIFEVGTRQLTTTCFDMVMNES
jgi:hypothetical protein